MGRLSAQDVARRYVEEFGPKLEDMVRDHPEWDFLDYENMPVTLFGALTHDLVVNEQVPQIGSYLRAFPESFHLRATQVEASVMNILCLACVRARYQGFSLSDTLAGIVKAGA